MMKSISFKLLIFVLCTLIISCGEENDSNDISTTDNLHMSMTVPFSGGKFSVELKDDKTGEYFTHVISKISVSEWWLHANSSGNSSVRMANLVVQENSTNQERNAVIKFMDNLGNSIQLNVTQEVYHEPRKNHTDELCNAVSEYDAW